MTDLPGWTQSEFQELQLDTKHRLEVRGPAVLDFGEDGIVTIHEGCAASFLVTQEEADEIRRQLSA